jgi:hypothetical protein
LASGALTPPRTCRAACREGVKAALQTAHASNANSIKSFIIQTFVLAGGNGGASWAESTTCAAQDHKCTFQLEVCQTERSRVLALILAPKLLNMQSELNDLLEEALAAVRAEDDSHAEDCYARALKAAVTAYGEEDVVTARCSLALSAHALDTFTALHDTTEHSEEIPEQYMNTRMQRFALLHYEQQSAWAPRSSHG